ncbi:MAG TPA: hypothetical protein VNO30_02340 [Kofleriaceae bacterium]|nr:hypothetical protein [Kofleriaceae bacterium]
MRRSPLLCLLLIAAAAAPARAGDRNELTIGSWNRALRSASANAVTDDNLTGGALTYARDLALHPVPGLAVWATGAFSWAGAEGTMFRTLATDVGALGLSAGGRARYHLHERVALSGRLDLGAARTKLRIEDSMGHAAGDARWGAIATAAAALDLYAIAGPRFSLGLRAELGYTAASAPELTAEPDGDGDGDTILLPRSEASLGHLDLGGRFFGFSLVSQF